MRRIAAYFLCNFWLGEKHCPASGGITVLFIAQLQAEAGFFIHPPLQPPEAVRSLLTEHQLVAKTQLAAVFRLDFPASSANKGALIQTLNRLQDKAAEILDSFVSDHDSLTTTKGKDVASYLAWKHAFQELVSAELSEIYRKRIPDSGDYCL